MQALLESYLAALPDGTFPTSAEKSDAAPTMPGDERLRHLDNMQRLAMEVDCPLQVVAPLYEKTLARLKMQARIPDYLPILVAKGVKSALKDIARRQ